MTGVVHIVIARKPIKSSVADNCLVWGCGAINVGACRIGVVTDENSSTRWPANLILDLSDDVQNGFPETVSCGKRNGEITNTPARSWKNTSNAGIARIDYNDSGRAARFFFGFGEQLSDE